MMKRKKRVTNMKLGKAIDKIFSHNNIIAIYKDNSTDHESVMIWRGEAWRMPPMYRDERHWMIFGAVAESLWESDTINIRIIRSK